MTTQKRDNISPIRRKKAVVKATPVPVDFSYIRILRDQFVFDERTGTFHRTTESAAYILSELKRSTPVTLISAQYADRYQVGQAIAERDVELFLNDLSIVGLQTYDVSSTR